MRERSTSRARAVAAAAVVGGFLLLATVVAVSLDGDGDGGPRGQRAGGALQDGGERRGRPPAFYVVQNGDTLTSISRKTGVSVQRIEALNPHVDPQILVSGERLKLR